MPGLGAVLAALGVGVAVAQVLPRDSGLAPGLKLAERGGPRARKKAVVAVARKLAVLLLALWRDEAFYRPKRRSRQAA